MIEYRYKKTGEVVTDSDFRSRYKLTSFPKVLDKGIYESFGIDPIFEGPHAKCTSPYEYAVRDGIERIGKKWYTKYSLRYHDKDVIDTQYADGIREKRNELIKESDWRAVSDRMLEPEWREYRQALRDITSQDGFPHDVKWPIVPS